MTLTLEEIKERILTRYDPDDILIALQITSDDLLDKFEEKLLENMYKFNDIVEEYV